MKHTSVNLIITDIKKHQADFSDLFDNMREATHEENESINNYIKSISKSTGINIYDIMKQPNKTKFSTDFLQF